MALLTNLKEKLGWNTWEKWHPHSQNVVKLFPLLLILLAIPLTVKVAQENQNFFQEASRRCHGNQNCINSQPPTPTPAAFYLTQGPTAQNITKDSAIISWSLSNSGTGQVEYGTTTSYGSNTVAETSFNYSTHSQLLSNLSAGTAYHYRIKSTSQAGTTITSSDLTFSTLAISGTTLTPTPSLAPTVTPTPIVTQGTYPADSSLKYIATPQVSLPGYLTSLTDSVLGTKTIRISNTSGVRQEYSRYPAWNSDGSKILLGFGYPGRMIDGKTYADLGSFSELSGAIWSNTNPNKLWGVDGGGANILYTQDATTQKITPYYTFSGYSAIAIGGDSGRSAWEGGISDDDRYICITAYGKSDGAHLITFDTVNKVILGDIVAPSNLDNAQISRKGNYVVVVADDTFVYDRNLSNRRTLTTTANHGDNALDANGNEIYVGNNANEFGGTQVVAFNLATGARTTLLSGSAFEYGHTSGRNIKRPGWVYLSVYNNTITAGRPGHDQVIAVKTDGSQTVEIFAFTHHTDTANYADQPHAVPSPDGSKVIFASEWGGSQVYAFLAQK